MNGVLEEQFSQMITSISNTDSNINMKKSCRICLSQFDLGIPLFEPTESLNNATAASLIWKCFGIKIYENEELFNQICNECTMNILISHNFKIQLQQSHKLLQSQYPNNYECCNHDVLNRQFSTVKVDENLYKIVGVVNNDNSNENYIDIVNSLKLHEKIELTDTNTLLLLVLNKPSNSKVRTVSNLKESTDIKSIPQNIDEAKKWLKLVRLSGPPYECVVCNCNYQSRYATFYAHVRLHFAKRIQCNICPVKYLVGREKYHMRKHTNEKPYNCPNCNKKFSMKNHLNQHLKLRCRMKNEHVCKVCRQVFDRYKLMLNHLLEDHKMCRHEKIKTDCKICRKENEIKSMCEYCGLKVTRYNRHLNTCKAAPITNKFQLDSSKTCDKCGELIFSEYQMKDHMKKHKNNQCNICKVCGKKFLQKRYLKDHMEIHEDKKYTCEKCGKIFKRQIVLRLHKRIHSDVRKHICTVCQKCFLTKDHLNKHKTVHTKIKPFTCKICNKSFGLKGNLTQHLLVHVKVKYFSCSVCKKTFAAEGNLKRHMVQHKVDSSGGSSG